MVSKAEILRLIYQGRFLHCNVTLGALGLPLGKTTVMHLVPRDNLPEPNSQGELICYWNLRHAEGRESKPVSWLPFQISGRRARGRRVGAVRMRAASCNRALLTYYDYNKE